MTQDSFRVDFRRSFLTGLAALLPITVTIFILWQLYRLVDGYCRPLGNFIYSWALGGEAKVNPILATIVSLAMVAVIVYLVGRLAVTYLGRLFFTWVDKISLKFPVIRAIYPYAKQITEFIFADKKMKFTRAVAVEYPRKGIYSLGFVTADSLSRVPRKDGKKNVNVFIPSSPTPFTGYVIFVPEDELVDLDLDVDEALRLTVSGGVLVPETKPPAEKPSKETDAQPEQK